MMLDPGSAIVVDVGKTLSKVTLWSRFGRMLDRQVRPNARCSVDGLKRLDVDAIGRWVVDAIGRYREHPVETIVPVGHGAAVAGLIDGKLAFPPLDYEQELPSDLLSAYRAERDPFVITGSPALPGGLNLGSQLYWLERLYPGLLQQATLVPWAQYWTWFLCEEAVSEVTSLGCHSDLWAPEAGGFSPMAHRLGWATRFAPLARAGDVAGTLRPGVAHATGLSEDVAVLTGLHDSNASLLGARGFAELAGEEATILSTGTWFIAMRLAKAPVASARLSEIRDCVVNVDTAGRVVPSARFMGGREIEAVIEIDTRRVDIKPDQPKLLAAVASVVREGAMLLPTLASGSGPFPHNVGKWLNRPEDWYARRAAACLYGAMVTDASLDLIGARERLLIEGRFAEAEVFVRAIASLRPDTRIYTASAHNDVSFGALRLIDSAIRPEGKLSIIEPLEIDLEPYRAAWREQLSLAA